MEFESKNDSSFWSAVLEGKIDKFRKRMTEVEILVNSFEERIQKLEYGEDFVDNLKQRSQKDKQSREEEIFKKFAEIQKQNGEHLLKQIEPQILTLFDKERNELVDKIQIYNEESVAKIDETKEIAKSVAYSMELIEMKE